MGMQLSFSEWERSIVSSGLVGSFNGGRYTDINPVEALIAVCNISVEHDIKLIRPPKNLIYAIQLSNRGAPHLPARTVDSLNSFHRSIIYIYLLDQGVDVWRPTEGEMVADLIFKVLPTDNYDPELEHWEFPPGSIVRCEKHILGDLGGNIVMVAVEKVVPYPELT